MGSHKIDLMSHFADVTPYFLDLNRGRLPSPSINVTDTPATRPETTRRSWTGERHESSCLNFHHQASARINFYAHLMTPTLSFLFSSVQPHRIVFHLNRSILVVLRASICHKNLLYYTLYSPIHFYCPPPRNMRN